MAAENSFFQNYILKPEKCLLISCLPQSLKDYEYQKKSPNHEFVKNYSGSWLKYQFEIGDTLNAVLPKIVSTGASVIEGASLEKFSLAFDEHVKLVMLIGHHNDNFIEFFDGLYPILTVVSKIPDECEIIFDLCICDPLKFVEILDIKFPKSLVRFSNTKMSITYWLYYYLILLTYLKEYNSNFFNAFKDVTNIFHQMKKELK